MRSSKPPIWRKSGDSVTQTQTSAFSAHNKNERNRSSTSVIGITRRLSEGDLRRKTPPTGIRTVNVIVGKANRYMASAPAGRHGLVVASLQSDLESERAGMIESLEKEREKLSEMETKPKTALSNINKQKEKIKTLENKIREHNNASKLALGSLRPPTITTKPHKNVPKPTVYRSLPTNLLSQVSPKNTQSTDKKTQTSTKKTQTSTKKTKKQTKKTQKPPKTTTTSTQTSSPKTTTTSTQTSSPKKTPSPKPTTIQPLVTNRSVNKIVKAITERDAKVPTTPPGVTKTNLQKFLVPFKQPVSIKFAPSIRATGGTGGAGGNATIIQTKNKKNDDKKKKPIKKFNILADPASAYRKSVVASKRKEIMSKLRTPTVGQRKKHVIQLIDKELRKMKVPKDIERKMISLYSKVLSEKQIKQLFGGRSAADVKKILKKQVDYFKKKKR